jgi:hypothetical protein
MEALKERMWVLNITFDIGIKIVGKGRGFWVAKYFKLDLIFKQKSHYFVLF